MDPQTKPKSPAGPMILLVILLVDVGLIIWGWHLYQRRQERLDATGLNLAKPPPAERPMASAAVPRPARPPTGPERYVLQEPSAPPGAGPAGRAAPAGTRSASSSERSGTIRAAVRAYYALKKDPRFSRSEAILAWKAEFLSHADLRAINARYQKDRDALRFMVDMTRSANFRAMLKKHALEGDITAFIREMASRPQVAASAPHFLRDPGVSSAAKELGLGAAARTPEGAEAVRRIQAGPGLRKLLGEEADGAVPLE